MNWFTNIVDKLFVAKADQPSPQSSQLQVSQINTNSRNLETADAIDRSKVLAKEFAKDFDSGIRSVYVYKDGAGSIFFVGIDIEGEHFSSNPSSYVKGYVQNTLKGEYSIEILKSNISSEAANYLKDRVLELYSEDVINTQNFHRKFDMEIFGRYKAALDNYKTTLQSGLFFEKTDIAQAIFEYERAFNYYIEAMNSRNYDATEAYLKAHTPPPPSKLADRISICLKKTKEHQRLVDFSERYFLYFTRSERTSGEMNLLKRFLEARNALIEMSSN